VAGRRSPGRQFGWLWAAYAASAAGTWLAFDAFSLIAILVLHAGPTQVAVLAAAGLAAGAAVAVPLGPWVEFRRKRPVMMAMDLTRFAAVASIPAAFALGWLSFAQLLAVSVTVAAADIAFTSASGAYLKALLRGEDLLIANARLEATTWTATAAGPPLGGAAIGLLGPVTTVAANAVSFLLSAAGIRAMGGTEAQPARPAGAVPQGGAASRARDLGEGWRYIWARPALRPLFLNTIGVNGFIMATAPVVAVLMLGRLGFAPWQYGLAFGTPCVGGLIGARLARPLAARYGSRRVMRVAGALRSCWLLWLAFIPAGPAGIALVIAAQFGVVTSVGVFSPVYATYRLEQIEPGRVARALAAWSISTKASTAAMTALWGLLADAVGPRVAIAAAGILILATPLVLPRRAPGSEPAPLGQVPAQTEPEPASGASPLSGGTSRALAPLSSGTVPAAADARLQRR